MPHYAPYGNAIYGITAYGSPPPVSVQTTLTVSPIPTSGTPNIGLYDSLYLNWVLPGGNWNQLILVRSSFAVPSSPFGNDGTQLFNQTSQFSTSFTDTGLQTGRFYYYALFVFDTDVDEWLMAASAQGLCLTDYGFENFFVAWTPDWYMEQDQLLTPPNPLRRFFGLIGFEMNWVRSEIETLFTLNSPEYISGAMLPYLGGNVGIGYEPALGMGLSRNLVSQAVQLYKTKGTFPGVQGAAAAYSGYGCTLTLGPNLEIQLDDATADRSSGHWTVQNSTTTLSTISAIAAGVVPAEHTTYLPIQGNNGISNGLLTSFNVNGYLPVNANNVYLLSANSSFAWTQGIQNSTLPPNLYGAAMVYDATNGTTVLFGGVDGSNNYYSQTWIFNGSYWSQAFPATVPPARASHGMAYDSASGTVIMFGGNTQALTLLNDTWSWNGTNWTLLSPATKPSARYGLGMAQWASTGVLLFGGETGFVGSGTFVQDTWLWNGTNWVAQSPVSKPSARIGHGMAYNSFEQATPSGGSGSIVLFGGENGASLNDTWLWNGTNWIVQSPGTSPSIRAFMGMAYNIATDSVELFGGSDFFSGGGATHLGDTWIWGGSNWKQINNSINNPPGRFQPVLGYDTKGTMVLYGGIGSGGAVLGDTWVWTPSTAQWAQIEGTQTPLPRQGAAIAYDTATAAVLLWGGWNSTTNTYYNSTWQWTVAAGWTQLTPTSNPPAGWGASMAYTTAGNVYLFGGVNGTTYSNQVWQWNGTNWAHILTNGGPPAARAHAQMVYDASLAKIILFGGEVSGPGTTGDTWYFTTGTATWASQSPSSPPGPQAYGGFVYTTGGLSILFGGTSEGISGSVNNNTFQFNSGTGQWTQLSPANSPTPRYGHAMVYNSSNSSIFLFGGTATGGGALSDSWDYTSSNWQTVNFGTPNPMPRSYAAAAYDVAANSILFFGGFNISNSTNNGDTWTSSTVGGQISISECNTSTATTLGIPVVPSNSYMLNTVAPVGWWRLNETFAGPVYDSGSIGSSGGNGGLFGTGTLIGEGNPPSAVPIDSYYVFNGNGYVSIPNNENYQFGATASFAFGGFFKTTTTPNTPMYAFTTQSSPASNSVGYGITYTNGYITVQVSDGTNHPTTGTQAGNWADNAWHFIVAVVDRVSGNLFCYVDGRLQGSTPLGALGSSANTNPLGIGGVGTGAAGTRRFSGSIQSAFITALDMSQSQVSSLYTSLLGQTQPVTQSQYVLSGYFQPLPSAVTLEQFTAQLDWYSSVGALISSSVGSPVTEIAGQWVRASVVATPPAGAAYIGRTFNSVSNTMLGDSHLFDAVQTEVNTQATPGPSPWTPPRDLQLNLFPFARNLVINGQGTLGTTGFDNAGRPSVITAVNTGPTPTSGPTWPANVSAGFSVTSYNAFGLNFFNFETAFAAPAQLPVNPGEAYSGSIWVIYPTGYSTNNTATLSINWYGTTDPGSFISSTAGPTISGVTIGEANGNWIQAVNLDATAPPGAHYAQLSLSSQTNAAGTYYVAAPCFGPGLNTAYFDGLFSPSPDYAYEGTPIISPSAWYPNVLTRLDRLIEVMPQYIPIGATFSIFTHANAWANVGLH